MLEVFEILAPSQDALSSGFARHVLKRCCRLGKCCKAAVLSFDWQVLGNSSLKTRLRPQLATVGLKFAFSVLCFQS